MLNKIKNFYFYNTAIIRKHKVKEKNFSIISNNCWGGMVYKTLGLQYNSPTVGCFFMSEDYLTFLKYLDKFVLVDPIFINKNQSKWKKYFEKNNKKISYPIMLLEYLDKKVEIFMVHYNSEEEAKIKWNRRKKRINYNKILIKMSEQNNFSQDILSEFEGLNYNNKVCFTCSSKYEGNNLIKTANYKNDKDIDINDEPKLKYKEFNLIKLINNL